MNNLLQEQYHGSGYVITYTYEGSNLPFITNIPVNTINPRLEFRYDAIRILNITTDMMTEDWNNPGNGIPMLPILPPKSLGNPSPIAVPSLSTVEIMFDINHEINFPNLWDRVKLFMHTSFGNSIKNGYLCEVDESYHKLVKKYPLLYHNFELWFTIEGGKKYLHQKWIHLF
jgi:hypothetical protein